MLGAWCLVLGDWCLVLNALYYTQTAYHFYPTIEKIGSEVRLISSANTLRGEATLETTLGQMAPPKSRHPLRMPPGSGGIRRGCPQPSLDALDFRSDVIS